MIWTGREMGIIPLWGSLEMPGISGQEPSVNTMKWGFIELNQSLQMLWEIEHILLRNTVREIMNVPLWAIHWERLGIFHLGILWERLWGMEWESLGIFRCEGYNERDWECSILRDAVREFGNLLMLGMFHCERYSERDYDCCSRSRRYCQRALASIWSQLLWSNFLNWKNQTFSALPWPKIILSLQGVRLKQGCPILCETRVQHFALKDLILLNWRAWSVCWFNLVS